MKKLFYNPIEHPVAVKLESKVLGVNKQYEPYTGEGPVGMDELFKLHLLRINARLITRPLLEKSVFRAACLNGFYHLDSRDGSSRELSRVAHLYAREVHALF